MKKETLMALQNDFDVIYDATNLNKKRRSDIIKSAKMCDAEVNAYLCCTPINIILERNITRQERQIPWDKLIQMIQSIEPPMYYEGFDNIYLIDGGVNHKKNKKWLLNTLAGYYFYNQNNSSMVKTIRFLSFRRRILTMPHWELNLMALPTIFSRT